MSNAEKIQVVINTLETLKMNTTYENVNRMLGIYQTLTEIRDDLEREAEERAGETDAE